MPGLTKREAAAIAAMQGMLSNPKWYKGALAHCSARRQTVQQVIAGDAVRQADALFDEMERWDDGS